MSSAISPFCEELSKEAWTNQQLSIVVFGASGDLSVKKCFPALFELYCLGMMPKNTVIWGYARSKKTKSEFVTSIRPFLTPKLETFNLKEDVLTAFLEIVDYTYGEYDDEKTLSALSRTITERHKDISALLKADRSAATNENSCKKNTEDEGEEKTSTSHLIENRMFYLALPPQIFLTAARCVEHCMKLPNESGFTRIVVEKPFGFSTDSAIELQNNLSKHFCEKELYRIDHYLGKELVQNMLILRFANIVLEPIWNREFIQSVTVSFKEDFGTEGRGGYFEKSGTIRDVMQNHLLQVVALLAMEAPIKIRGEGHAEYIRDEKVKLLRCIEPWKAENIVLGQYKGYKNDATVSKSSNRETYCCAVFRILNARWEGVPFILKAGKNLDERKAEIRVQFRTPPGAKFMFGSQGDKHGVPNQELVIRLQPKESIYMKTNLKKPGLQTDVVTSELDLTYEKALKGTSEHIAALKTDAYTRLILDVFRGKQATFVRNDELLAAWKVVTPVLDEIEDGAQNVRPEVNVVEYDIRSRGPKEADDLVKAAGYEYDASYANWWKERKGRI